MKDIKICIKSEFIDYYDTAFDLSYFPHDVEWNRTINNGVKRRDVLKSLDSTGVMTPRHGLVEDVIIALKEDKTSSQEVVIYTDEYAHCGQGKIKLPISQPKNGKDVIVQNTSNQMEKTQYHIGY